MLRLNIRPPPTFESDARTPAVSFLLLDSGRISSSPYWNWYSPRNSILLFTLNTYNLRWHWRAAIFTVPSHCNVFTALRAYHSSISFNCSLTFVILSLIFLITSGIWFHICKNGLVITSLVFASSGTESPVKTIRKHSSFVVTSFSLSSSLLTTDGLRSLESYVGRMQMSHVFAPDGGNCEVFSTQMRPNPEDWRRLTVSVDVLNWAMSLSRYSPR